MKMKTLTFTAAAVVAASLTLFAAKSSVSPDSHPAAIHSSIPNEGLAKTILQTTHRHREWINVPFGSAGIRAFVVYPDRADKAPVVMLSANKQGASDWIRAVGDQLAAEGTATLSGRLPKSQMPSIGWVAAKPPAGLMLW
jgi:carboxymethylenebutenolidase